MLLVAPPQGGFFGHGFQGLERATSKASNTWKTASSFFQSLEKRAAWVSFRPVKITDQELLIFDGATGTNIQQMRLPASAWEGKDGCNELLNVTAPEAIQGLHRAFLDAGAQVLETNTFGASRIVLAEYGLESRVAEINATAVANARAAIAGRAGRWV